jgi:hypothetical protein
MDEVLQHLEAAVASIESKVEESPLFQDVLNRLNDVKNVVVNAKAELEASVSEQPAAETPPAPQEEPSSPAPAESDQPASETETPPASSADEVTPPADGSEQVTNEDGSPVTDPNAAR